MPSGVFCTAHPIADAPNHERSEDGHEKPESRDWIDTIKVC